MARNKNMKVQKDSTAAKERLTAALPKSYRKAPGTRLGMLRDWREASNTPGQTSGRVGSTVRDGR